MSPDDTMEARILAALDRKRADRERERRLDEQSRQARTGCRPRRRR